MPRCTRNSSQLASRDSSTRQVSWTDAESDLLLDLITSHKASAGDGLNFKMAFWNTAAARLPEPTKGAPKTAKSCKERWKRMKKTFDVVDRIVNMSAFTYSRELGANITLENEAIWLNFLKKNKHVRPFRNKGWPHYEKMKLLMPSKGKNLNCISAQPSGDVRLSASKSKSPQGSGNIIGLPASPPGNHQPSFPASNSAQTGSAQSGMPAIPSSSDTIPLPLLSAICEPTPGPSTQTQATFTWHTDQYQAHFSPPSVPSSFNGSAVSSIRPSSSISVRMAVSRERSADSNDDESVVSTSLSATAHSSISSGRERLTGNTDIARKLGGPRSDINKSDPGSHSIVHQARLNLLRLDAGKVSQSDIAMLFGIFQHDRDFADGYVLLAAEGFEDVRLAWLQYGIKSAMTTQSK
ncbi:hypothetical protein F5141DRAFT_1295423 [Pisolithus sp. B1]|nr:hypothetical protein F5141DRAFT_1295423 [Pisolithus sp. B1]